MFILSFKERAAVKTWYRQKKKKTRKNGRSISNIYEKLKMVNLKIMKTCYLLLKCFLLSSSIYRFRLSILISDFARFVVISIWHTCIITAVADLFCSWGKNVHMHILQYKTIMIISKKKFGRVVLEKSNKKSSRTNIK